MGAWHRLYLRIFPGLSLFTGLGLVRVVYIPTFLVAALHVRLRFVCARNRCGSLCCLSPIFPGRPRRSYDGSVFSCCK